MFLLHILLPLLIFPDYVKELVKTIYAWLMSDLKIKNAFFSPVLQTSIMSDDMVLQSLLVSYL